MNKNYILTYLLFFLSFTCFSQIQFGFQGGVGFSTQSLNWKDKDQEPEPDYRPGFNVGFVSDIFLVERISLQPGILYSSKGYKGENGFQFITNYIEIPLLVKYQISDKFHGLAGPYIAIGIKGSIESDLFEAELEFVTKEIGSDEAIGSNFVERYDYGITLGFGYDLNEHFGTRLTYSQGLSNLSVDIVPVDSPIPELIPFEFNSNDRKAFNRAFSLSIVYFLRKN